MLKPRCRPERDFGCLRTVGTSRKLAVPEEEESHHLNFTHAPFGPRVAMGMALSVLVLAGVFHYNSPQGRVLLPALDPRLVKECKDVPTMTDFNLTRCAYLMSCSKRCRVQDMPGNSFSLVSSTNIWEACTNSHAYTTPGPPIWFMVDMEKGGRSGRRLVTKFGLFCCHTADCRRVSQKTAGRTDSIGKAGLYNCGLLLAYSE